MEIGRKIFYCLLIVSAGIFSACENEPYEGGSGGPNIPGNPDNALFSVLIDGEQFIGQQVEATMNEDGLEIGAQTGVQVFGIQIYEPVVGSFDMSDLNLGIFIYTADVSSETSPAYAMSSGTVTITSIDEASGTISGTFSGTLTDWFEEAPEIVLTEGIFENIPFADPAPTNNATALVDGESFNASTFATGSSGATVTLNFIGSTGETITINLPIDAEPGEYAVTTMGAAYSGTYSYTEGSEEFTYHSVPNSGTITIISVTEGIITGTFAFDAVSMSNPDDIVSITEGNFEMGL